MNARGTLFVVLALACMPACAAAGDRLLRAEVEVAAPIDSVWSAWTTEPGVRSFFAPGCRIEPKVDGAYEIWFMPSAPAGQRGGDDLRVLAFEPNRRLAFTWNAPPSLPYARAQRTMVVIDLEPVGDRRTRVRLTHLGWGEGKEWDAAFDYFANAWNVQVLPFLKDRFEHGPVDWARTDTVRARIKPAVADMRVQLIPKPAK